MSSWLIILGVVFFAAVGYVVLKVLRAAINALKEALRAVLELLERGCIAVSVVMFGAILGLAVFAPDILKAAVALLTGR